MRNGPPFRGFRCLLTTFVGITLKLPREVARATKAPFQLLSLHSSRVNQANWENNALWNLEQCYCMQNHPNPAALRLRGGCCGFEQKGITI